VRRARLLPYPRGPALSGERRSQAGGAGAGVSYPIYLVHARASESPALARAIELLREVARDDFDWSRWYYEI